MRVPILVLTSLVLTFFTLGILPMRLQAQKSTPDLILQAFHSWSEGQPKAAIAILEPMLQAGVNGAEERDLGVAWNVLGSAYMDLEMYDKAERAYQQSIEKLRAIPAAQAQYASSIDSLGTLEESLGQKDQAKALCEKARHIYEGLGDSAGVAITSTNLAVIAYGKKDFKGARRNMERASQEAQHATGMGDDDVAAMDAMSSALALHDGRNEEAMSTIQQAIDHWKHAHGPGYFMLGTGYLLRAQALAKSGDYPRAIADARQALAIAEGAVGRNTFAYVSAENVYARILQASGAKEEGARLRKEATGTLADLELRLCNGCTISASGFR
ncbi:MAG TPA: tetratricopeptide repeat protein [Acidobacteriaceae bacterium]|jgi:tetratricopeptide (TPR) repeat protein|nr:tetratricopeptide repeat protein [Acidobacteriaceae bacterium]